jgi:hypothetical protein
MRADMAKVIVERPRIGSRLRRGNGERRKWQKLPPEEWLHREPIKPRQGCTKYLNEHLSPLRRYLHGQVGRPWDKVFSEICRHIRLDSAVQSHVRDHLADFVETNVIEIDGVLCTGTWPIGRPLEHCYKQLYVCPRTGLLRSVKRPKAVARSRPVESIASDSGRMYRLIDGLWYELTLRPITQETLGCRDVMLKCTVRDLPQWEAKRTYGAVVFAVAKRQLNKREIRRLASR